MVHCVSIKTKAALHYIAQPLLRSRSTVTELAGTIPIGHRGTLVNNWPNTQGRFINSLFTVYTLFNIYSRGNWNNGLAIFGVF